MIVIIYCLFVCLFIVCLFIVCLLFVCLFVRQHRGTRGDSQPRRPKRRERSSEGTQIQGWNSGKINQYI